MSPWSYTFPPCFFYIHLHYYHLFSTFSIFSRYFIHLLSRPLSFNIFPLSLYKSSPPLFLVVLSFSTCFKKIFLSFYTSHSTLPKFSSTFLLFPSFTCFPLLLCSKYSVFFLYIFYFWEHSSELTSHTIPSFI